MKHISCHWLFMPSGANTHTHADAQTKSISRNQARTAPGLKILAEIKKCKKKLVNASRFTKFMNLQCTVSWYNFELYTITVISLK